MILAPKHVQFWEFDAGEITLARLLDWCNEEHGVDRLLLSARLEKQRRGWVPLTEGVDDTVKRLFGKKVLEQFQATGWPGTKLIGHPGRVYIVQYDREIREILLKTETNLAGWLHDHRPPLPEDLCLFKEGAKLPALYSVTHESQAWLVTAASIPFKEAKKSPETETYLFEGKYFCEFE